MTNDEQPKVNRNRTTPAISRDSLDWSAQFVKHLRIEFESHVADSKRELSPGEYRQRMTQAFAHVLLDSGAAPYEAFHLLEGARRTLLSEDDGEWNETKNQRRVELIDKSIQGELSAEESFEFVRLTEQMRAVVETEASVPLAGANELHKRLLKNAQEQSQRE